MLEKGHEWNNDVKRKSREQQLINLYRDSGAIVYNFFDVDGIRRGPSCPLALRETILRNQSSEFREYISQLNTGRPNINRKGVICEGNTYLSVLEAASVYQCTRKVIRDKANGSRLDYMWATAEQIQLESQRRQRLGIVKLEPKNSTVAKRKRSSGKSQRVQINGQKYESLSAAAIDKNVSPQAICKSLAKKREGYYYLDDNDQPIPH